MAEKAVAETHGSDVYSCENPGCPLGSRKDHGRFAGGITAEQRSMLTGEPVETMEEGKHYGEGICPNCAEPAKPYDADAVRQASIREQIKALQADLKGDS